jgi:putative transcriptional regulator
VGEADEVAGTSLASFEPREMRLSPVEFPEVMAIARQFASQPEITVQWIIQRLPWLIHWTSLDYGSNGPDKMEVMSKVADSIRRGLQEALAYAEGQADESAYRVRVPDKIDVKAIRAGLDMTQEEFAGRFGFSVNTLRHWEQGSRQPEGPTRAYLLVIERAPKAVQKALLAI